MSDKFQLTSIIAAAIRDCHHQTVIAQPEGHSRDQLGDEDANCIAKAVLTALAEAGLEIAPKV